MSLYIALFGRNPHAAFYLAALNLTPEECGRFRDCYPSEDGTRIHIYTRNGGGNREDFMPDFSGHPQFEGDADADFDCTYATITFRTPPALVGVVRTLADRTNNTPPAERWRKLIDDMQSQKDTAVVGRALEVGKQIFGAINSGKDAVITTADGGAVSITQVKP